MSGRGNNVSANMNQPPSNNENAAKIAATCSGLIYGLVYPFSRIRESVMLDDNQREADINFFQQESPFFFTGIVRKNQSNQESAVFCKVWREGDRHTNRKKVDEEMQFYKRVNANNVPSPSVIHNLTVLDVKCMTLQDKFKPSIYHVLVTEYYHNDDVEENDILVFMLSFVLAVENLHSIGILHCDIKPNNILWDATQKVVRLINFDHAQDERNAKWCTATKTYQAPEISLGQPHTTKSDAYSVGKTLDSVIREFKKPVAHDIAAVVSSLLIESDVKRITLLEAEQQLQCSWSYLLWQIHQSWIYQRYFRENQNH